MKAPHLLTDEKLFFWAKKTHDTISRSYWNVGQDRRYELVDRYTELKEELIMRELWCRFCKTINACPTHDAYDVTA